jgi:hypothetical protein
MKIITILILSTVTPLVIGTATPDNFQLALDKDVHKMFGVRRNRTMTPDIKSKKKVKDVKVSTDTSIDDYSAAQDKIFHVVEDAEKSLLDAAKHLVEDEVNVLFGEDVDHHHHDDKSKDVKTSSKSAKNVKATDAPQDTRSRIAHIMEDAERRRAEVFRGHFGVGNAKKMMEASNKKPLDKKPMNKEPLDIEEIRHSFFDMIEPFE